MTVSGKKIALRVLSEGGGPNKPSNRDNCATCGNLLYGQCDHDAGAVLQAGFDTYAAAMRFNDAADDGRTNAGALGFGSAEYRGEGAPLQFFAHALARILEFHRDVRGLFAHPREADGPRFDRERATLRHRLGGV